MALTNNDIKFLFYAVKRGVQLNNTLMLGRLRFYGSLDFLSKIAERYSHQVALPEITDGYSEPVLKYLGAQQADSMDVSNYEHANIIHDLNSPVPDELHNKYSAIIDGGTLEHIFNFPQAITNCMKMLRTGGHFIGITPVNNLMGHGFYQFSPELYYRVFSAENGFKITTMLITAVDETGAYNEWYEVLDPAAVKSRVILVNSLPTYLMLIAEKTRDETIFNHVPQQSDYSEKWLRTDSKNHESSVSKIMARILPVKIIAVMHAIRSALRSSSYKTKDLGVLNEKHYKRITDI